MSNNYPSENENLGMNDNTDIFDDSNEMESSRKSSGKKPNWVLIAGICAAVVVVALGAILLFRGCGKRVEPVLTISKHQAGLLVGTADTLLAQVDPELPITFESDNESVAVVSSKGVVTALSVGSANVKAVVQPKHGDPVVAACHYVVTQPEEDEVIDSTAILDSIRVADSLAKAKKKTSGKGKVDLGYAVYEGQIQNGKPHGNGRMSFKNRQEIPGTYGVFAYPGERIIGVWREGKINLGTLYQSNGNQLVVKYGQSPNGEY